MELSNRMNELKEKVHNKKKKRGRKKLMSFSVTLRKTIMFTTIMYSNVYFWEFQMEKLNK